MDYNESMQITIKPYTSEDKPYFTKYLRAIYKYLETRDPYHKLAWDDTYSDFQADEELKNLEKNHAEIFMAYAYTTVVGMVVVSIPNKTQSYSKMHIPSIDGKIELLYVEKAYRKQGIGKMLLEYGEKRLKEQGCIYISLEVMPINDAYELYTHQGYTDRSISMLKKITS